MSDKSKRRKQARKQANITNLTTRGSLSSSEKGTQQSQTVPEMMTSHSATVRPPRRWTKAAAKIFIGGGLLGAVLTVLGTSLLQELRDWYDRPKLYLSVAAMDLAVTGSRQGSEIIDYANLTDREYNCVIMGYSFTGKEPDMRLWDSQSEFLIKVFMYNSGRTPVSDVQFALNHSSDQEWIGAESTPGIDIDVAKSKSTGIETHVVKVRTIRPGYSGVLTLKVWEGGPKLSIIGRDRDQHFSESPEGTVPYKLIYLGSKELGDKALPVKTSARDILWRESKLYGETEIPLPFPEYPGLRRTAKSPIPWKMVAIIPGQHDACPVPPDSPKVMKFTVPVHARITDVHK
jgi:hypothetical protein